MKYESVLKNEIRKCRCVNNVTFS